MENPEWMNEIICEAVNEKQNKERLKQLFDDCVKYNSNINPCIQLKHEKNQTTYFDSYVLANGKLNYVKCQYLYCEKTNLLLIYCDSGMYIATKKQMDNPDQYTCITDTNEIIVKDNHICYCIDKNTFYDLSLTHNEIETIFKMLFGIDLFYEINKDEIQKEKPKVSVFVKRLMFINTFLLGYIIYRAIASEFHGYGLVIIFGTIMGLIMVAEAKFFGFIDA